MFKATLKSLLLVSLLALVLAACSTTPPTKQVTLIAEDIEWDITEITAEPGQMIELTLRNEGALDHNLVIEELDIDILVSPGQEKVVTFTVGETGRIAFICNVPGHEEAGMVGEIIIGESP